MLFLKKIAGFLFFLLMAVSGGFVVSVALGVVSSSFVAGLIDSMRADMNLSVAVGLTGGVVILTGLFVFLKVRKTTGRDKLITFQNPDGEVTVSVSAIENYVKRVARDIPGIADARVTAKVGKKGISITSYVAISAGTNIPEVTENIQLIVRSKVRDMLGVEERVNVQMHVTSILKEDSSTEETHPGEEKPSSPPFRETE